MLTVVTDIGSVCSSCVSVTIPLLTGEAGKLKEALSVVETYKMAALEALKKRGLDPTSSDWHSIEYCVKNNKVTVIIKDGMIG